MGLDTAARFRFPTPVYRLALLSGPTRMQFGRLTSFQREIAPLQWSMPSIDGITGSLPVRMRALILSGTYAH